VRLPVHPCHLRRRQLHSQCPTARSQFRSLVCDNISGCRNRTRLSLRRAFGFPRSAHAGVGKSQILGKVARHNLWSYRPIQVVSQPQLTPPFFDPRLRIFAADALQESFGGRLSAISRRYLSRHTARPRTCWNYGGAWHAEHSSIVRRCAGGASFEDFFVRIACAALTASLEGDNSASRRRRCGRVRKRRNGACQPTFSCAKRLRPRPAAT
jgi:hypothetical protein